MLGDVGKTVNPVDEWHLPLDRAVRLAGASGDAIEVALQDLSEDGPAVIRLHVAASGRQSVIIDETLSALTDAAIELFPSWLPAAAGVTGHSSVDFAAVRIHARHLAATSKHYGPFLSDLAERALGASTHRRFSDAELAEGLAAILGTSWGRDRVALLLSSDEPAPQQQRAFAAAAEWLAARGFAVWLVDTRLSVVDRLCTVYVRLPEYLRDVEDDAPPKDRPRRPEYRAVAGKPHPGSEVEKLIDRELSKHGWAANRRLNDPYQFSPIAPKFYLDIAWPDDRFVVELDGYEHFSAYQWAKDRLRDKLLKVAGYHVLRIPNHEVSTDVWKVVRAIGNALHEHRATLFATKEGQTK